MTSAGFALPPLPDRLTSLSLSFLDLKGLSNLAGAHRRFIPLVHASSSDLAKIQQVATRCGRDLGFGIPFADDGGDTRSHRFENIGSNVRYVSWYQRHTYCMQCLLDRPCSKTLNLSDLPIVIYSH